MRCETAVAILASEGLALVSVSRQQALELIIGAFVVRSLVFSFFPTLKLQRKGKIRFLLRRNTFFPLEFAIALRVSKRKYRSCAQT